ncbi:MAG: TerB N-terminal domain-containing protein [Oscillospiraceae bacterium]|nr:TerB N-terminal domain-containing protein [Oscillospiraceae bacterium]
MDGSGRDKKYESVKLPRRPAGGGNPPALRVNPDLPPVSLSDEIYYEIEYDTCPIPGVGKFVPKSQAIQAPEPDPIRDRFAEMRDIGRTHRYTYYLSRAFDRHMQYDAGTIFYKQALFMADFTDDYRGNMPFSQYFPYYQMMGYEQLRTYFTWRTAVRQGQVAATSLSYGFLYIYELLCNIGVRDAQEGLDRLMAFWRAFRVYDETIDSYVIRWLQDYHIYYELPQTFPAFIAEHNLGEHYPQVVGADDKFSLFCSISKYDIRKSGFFSDERAGLIGDCFAFVTDWLRQICVEHGLDFDESIFGSAKHMSVWTPFEGALFYQWAEQRDRRVVLSDYEVYECKENKWTFRSLIPSEGGRQLIGYVMKQMEAALRQATGYKFKLSANLSGVIHPLVEVLAEGDLSLEEMIKDAVRVFYREATKTVVTVEPGALSVIRREALVTQEKLIVPEAEEGIAPLPRQEMPPPTIEPSSGPAASDGFKNTFTERELQALAVVLSGEMELKEFADEWGVMLEVLVDGINEKAMDYLGDSLLDEDFALYEDYREEAEELIR